VGGVTSHTAIVARSLGIPAIVGLHHARQMISEGETVIVDGTQGLLIVNPDPIVLAEYRARQAELKTERKRLKRLKSTPAATVDGTPIELFANIELPQDMTEVLEAGAEGVGLFRTEFMFLNRSELPREEEQFEAYRDVAKGDERAPGGAAHARPGRRQGAQRQRRAAHHAQPGDGAARDPLLPGRAADLPHPAARHPARLALRQGQDPAADARARARDRPDAHAHQPGQGAARRARQPYDREIRSAA
jgi:hypothetical protein